METFKQPKITGYRQLTEQDAELINSVKDVGTAIEYLIETLRDKSRKIDQRWVDIGEVDLQKGLMALVRSVAQPTSF
jgi:hypothetical protein